MDCIIKLKNGVNCRLDSDYVYANKNLKTIKNYYILLNLRILRIELILNKLIR